MSEITEDQVIEAMQKYVHKDKEKRMSPQEIADVMGLDVDELLPLMQRKLDEVFKQMGGTVENGVSKNNS